eukprot:5561504-Prymnesium_polylepis.1
MGGSCPVVLSATSPRPVPFRLRHFPGRGAARTPPESGSHPQPQPTPSHPHPVMCANGPCAMPMAMTCGNTIP